MKSSSRRSSSWACTSWCPQWGAPQRWTWTCWSQYLRKDHGFCGIMTQLHLSVSIPAPPWQVLAIPQRGSGREDWNWFFFNENAYRGQVHKKVLIMMETFQSWQSDNHWDDYTWGNHRGPDMSWALCRSTWYELGWEMSICNGAKASIEISYFFRWMQLSPGGWEGL